MWTCSRNYIHRFPQDRKWRHILDRCKSHGFIPSERNPLLDGCNALRSSPINRFSPSSPSRDTVQAFGLPTYYGLVGRCTQMITSYEAVQRCWNPLGSLLRSPCVAPRAKYSNARRRQ